MFAKDKGEAEDGKLVFNGYRVSVWDNGKLWEMDIDEYEYMLMLLNFTTKKSWNNKFIQCILCIFYLSLKKWNKLYLTSSSL